ncbi:MAG TPA: hypothetical protein VKU02_17535 [Gemmataceae bacterium]|nr:hypothetical protein [Gemmataceae bacterium]
MFMRRRLSLALLGLAILIGPIRAADDTSAPTLVVRVRSIEGLLNDIKYVATLAGRGEEAKQLEGLISSRMGPKGLEGVDIKRPLGLYGTLDANLVESTAAVLVPISDQKAFLGLLEGFGFKAKKEDDSIYSVNVENLPFPVYFKFANQYVYVTAREKTALNQNKLLDPTKVLAGSPNETVSASFRIDQIPDVFKQLITSQLEVKLADLEDQKQPGETEAQRKLRIQATKESAKQVTAFFNEGSQLALRLGADRSANELYLEFTLSAKPNTELAKSIARAASTPSLFAGLHSPSSAAEIFFHGAVPENARQQFIKSIDEAFHSGVDKEKDPNKRAVVEKLYNAILPTLKAGELDAAADLRGPTKNKHYAIIAALKLKDAQGLEKVLRDLREQVPPSEKQKIKLDAETVGSVKVHRLDIQEQFDEQAKKLFGSNPIYVAFRPDALFIAGGDGGITLLKEGLATKSGAVPPFKIDLSVARLAPLIGDKQKADVNAVAQKAFGGTSKDNDRIQFTAEGGKNAKLRIALKADVIKFFSLLDKANKGEE